MSMSRRVARSVLSASIAMFASVFPIVSALARWPVVERITEYRNPATGEIFLQHQLVRSDEFSEELETRLSAGDDGGRDDGGGDDLEEMRVAGPSTRLDRAGPIDYAFRPSLKRGPSGELGAVWMEGPSDYPKVWFCYSLDGGLAWSRPERVDHVDGDGIRALNPVVEFDASGQVLVVWDYVDFQNGPFRTFFRKRSPVWGPAEWGPAKRLQDVNGNSQQLPSIVAVDDRRYFVVWSYEPAGAPPRILFRRTDDGGETWSGDFQVSHNPPGSFFLAREPALVVDVERRLPGHETIYVASTEWRANSFPDVYAYRSTDGGVSWNDGTRVSDIESGFQQMYREGLTQTSDGTLTALWDNDGGGHIDLRLRQSTDGGESWGPVVIVNPVGIRVSIYPSLKSFAERFAVAWEGQVRGLPDVDIFARVSATSSATTLGTPIRMTDTEGTDANPNRPSCALDGTGTVCAWDDLRRSYLTRIFASRADHLEASGVSEAGTRDGLIQLRCHPNPTPGWGATRICWEAMEGRVAGEVRSGVILLHDVSGRLVRRVDFADRSSGSVLLPSALEGEDPLATGVYLVTLVASGLRSNTARLCVVR